MTRRPGNPLLSRVRAATKSATEQRVKLDFVPSTSQKEVATALLTKKRVVVRAGRRFGKSALAINTVLREAIHNPGRYWLIAPQYTQAKSIYWRGLVDEYVPKELIVRKNDVEMILEIMAANGKTSIIEFKGSDREDALRGAGLKGVVLDEYAFQKEHVWAKIISPMLVQTRGWALFITTPNGVVNHFKAFWDEAVAKETEPESEWATFHFTTYDNPTIDKKDIDEERKHLTPEFFTQEYLAEFAKFTGMVLTSFNYDKHVKEFEINEEWSFYRAIDFGATDQNGVLFAGVDPSGVFHFFDEIYLSDILTSELAELIQQKSAHRYFIATYADSAAKQSRLDLAAYGIPSVPVSKNSGENSRQWLLATINQFNQLLADGKIVIHPRCVSFITEIQGYKWRETRDGVSYNIPEDKNNHLIDPARYLFFMYKSGSEIEEDLNYLRNGVNDSVIGY